MMDARGDPQRLARFVDAQWALGQEALGLLDALIERRIS